MFHVLPTSPDTRVRESMYWLSVEDTPGLRGTPQLTPGDPVRWEEDASYHTRWPSLNGDRWYGRELVTAPDRDRTSIQLALPVRASRYAPPPGRGRDDTPDASAHPQRQWPRARSRDLERHPLW
ncbi:MAG TPA: hypothetical protein VGD69_04965 [Herpetosiphonaceae bacterium]